jgi:hypothetical protein
MINRSLRKDILSIAVLAIVANGPAIIPVSTTTPRFYDDDPIVREPESQDATQAQSYTIVDLYEMTRNLFVTQRYKPTGLRAQNINTVDEVPDSSWFTNRLGSRAVTEDELVRGPNLGAPPDPSKWVLTRQKTAGAHPGLTAKDARGETWFMEFDRPYFPEGATSAIAIASKMFWALGYNQVESFVTTFDPRVVEFDPNATVKRPSGARTPFTRADMNEILAQVKRNPDGTYRAIAGRLIPGRIIGNALYEATRPDDPNDVVPHEHRRELRALRVFGAWTNLTDLKAANMIDSLVTENGRTVVKHYLQDVGSTFGMCNDLHQWDIGWEHYYEPHTTLKRLVSFGFALSPWQKVQYVEYPSVGKFEGDQFDPRTWKPQTPTTAYMELRDDDGFWAARRVAAFTDDLIRAVVHTGEFSDPAAEKYLGDVLVKRRNTIVRVYMTGINPIVSPRLETDTLTFANAAVDQDIAQAPRAYHASWMRFDNATGDTHLLATTDGRTTTVAVPGDLPTNPGAIVAVDLSADSDYPAWTRPIRTYFRRIGDGWKLVGLDRLPADAAPSQIASR